MGAFAEGHVFEFDGGRPALELVNTMGGLRGVRPNERLTAYPDLAFWALQLGLIDQRRMDALLAAAQGHPRKAALALEEAVVAREALHDVVVATIESREPPAPALEVVNAWIAEASSHRVLRPRSGGGFEGVFEDDGSLLAFLRPVAMDAADLLERGLAEGRVRRCEQASAGRCGWFFLDETRNHSRRWCNMKDCGNRAKQRRHWLRQKEG